MHKRGLFLSALLITVLAAFFLFFRYATKVRSANFTNASATMSNSRFSYFAGVSSGTSGNSNVTIDTSGYPDKDVDHLFPNDSVCFAPAALFGCRDNKAYGVTGTEGADGDQFTIDSPLGTTLSSTDVVIATQSGTITLTVTLATDVPDGGDIYITIPMADSVAGNDGIPDYNTAVGTSGFDLNTIAAANLSISTSTSGTCANGNWSIGSATITPGSGTTDHTIRIDRSGAACEANSTILTITLGNSSKGIVNPAPIFTTRTQGAADEYTINIKTRDNTDAPIDISNLMVAPVESVLVSATVQETLSFAVAGLASSTSACGVSTDVTTTAMAVPWGTISSSATFFDAAQQLTISTNANNGYSVTIQENDQMGKDGVGCSGNAPSTGHFTFTGPTTCIRDTVCGATPCTEVTGYGWSDASTYPGLGYSLANVGGDTDAAFVYNSNDPCSTSAGAGSFCSKQIAEVNSVTAETPQNVMYKTGPADTADAYVCFRITIPGTQPAGYYFNKVRYTAIPRF